MVFWAKPFCCPGPPGERRHQGTRAPHGETFGDRRDPFQDGPRALRGGGPKSNQGPLVSMPGIDSSLYELPVTRRGSGGKTSPSLFRRFRVSRSGRRSGVSGKLPPKVSTLGTAASHRRFSRWALPAFGRKTKRDWLSPRANYGRHLLDRFGNVVGQRGINPRDYRTGRTKFPIQRSSTPAGHPRIRRSSKISSIGPSTASTPRASARMCAPTVSFRVARRPNPAARQEPVPDQ